MKFKPFTELTGVLLREQCEPSGGRYWHIHKLKGSVCSPNLSFRKSIPRAINPCLQETKSSNSNNIIVITALQRDNKETQIY